MFQTGGLQPLSWRLVMEGGHPGSSSTDISPRVVEELRIGFQASATLIYAALEQHLNSQRVKAHSRII